MSVPASSPGRGRGSAASILSLAAGSAVLLWAVFTLPYHFPPRPLISASYLFGYNNRVGQLLVAIWLLLLAVFGPPVRLAAIAGKPLRRSTLVKTLALTGALTGLLYVTTRGVNGFNEAIYLIDRLHLLLQGQVPFRDFEFIYGAGMLYVPALLVWTLHLSATDAYGLVFVAASLLGVWLLYCTVSAATELRGSQRSVFLLFALGNVGGICSYGLNYTLLRFVLPCYFAVRVHRALFEADGVGRAYLLVPGFYAVLLLWSPEMGVAFAVGMAAYLAVFGLRQGQGRPWHFAAMVASLLVVTVLAAHLRVFAGMQRFSEGGYNFPVVPSLFLLLLLVAAALSALYVGQAVRTGSRGVLPALVAASALGIGAALGRCDQGHALTNPLGVLLAGFLLLSGYPWLRRGLFAVAWLIMFVLPAVGMVRGLPLTIAKADLPVFFAWEHHHHDSAQLTPADHRILDRMTRALGAAEAREKFDDFRAFGRHDGPLDADSLFGLPAGTVLYAPFGFAPGHGGTSHPAFVQEGYFFGLVNMTTAADVERKLAELQQPPRRPLVVLPTFAEQCGTTGEGTRALISAVAGYRYSRPVLHPFTLAIPVCEMIVRQYHPAGPPTSEQFGYQLWLPNAP